MLTLKIEDRIYSIKDSWEEVSFAEFIDLISVGQDSYSEYIKFIKTLSSLCSSETKGSFEDDLMNLSIEDFKALKDYFVWINDDITKVGKKDREKEYFEIDGKKFRMKSDFNKLTVGEMISLEMLLKNKKLDLNPLEIAFGILFRELDLNGKETEFNEENFLFIIKNLRERVNVVDIISHINFFLTGGKNSTIKSSKAYSIQVVKREQMNLEECQKKKSKNIKKKKKEN